MGYVAAKPLKWGDDTIEPGDPVPEGEPGRDYGQMLYNGEIVDEAAVLPDDEVRKQVADLRERLKAAEARVVELQEQVDKCDGAPAEDGPRLVLTDEQRELLAGKGLEGEFTLEELDAALSVDEDGETPPASEETAAETPATADATSDQNPAAEPQGDEPKGDESQTEGTTPPAETPTDPNAETTEDSDQLPEGVTDLGGGWYLLGDGETKVHGRKQLAEALEK
jgi:hypothetical protein